MQKKKVKFAVIGCGHIGMRHMAMIEANPDCELVAVCDVKPRAELNFSPEMTEKTFYGSLEELLKADNGLDVVCIATPNGLHESQALSALEAGYHVVIEKPMALTRSGAERVIYKALNKHKQVFCVMQNRYSPPSVWLKDILQEGILGKVYMVQINCYWNRDDRYYKPENKGTEKEAWHGSKSLDGGTLFTQFSHFIDLMYWYFGDITNIQAKFHDFNHQHSTDFEDSAFIMFDFIDGGIGSFNYSTAVWDKNLESSITIIAENGSVKVGGQYMNEVEYCHIKDYEMPVLPASNPPNDYGNYKGSAANHHYIFENIVEVINNGKPITTNALEGLKVIDIIEKMYSYKQQQ